jgi:hypothetical protein
VKKGPHIQDTSEFASIERLLKVIVALLLRRTEDEALPMKRQIGTLNDLGLRPVEIAEILGRTATYVNKELSGFRKNRRSE